MLRRPSLVALVVACSSASLYAQQPATQDANAVPGFSTPAPDSVDADLDDAAARPGGILPFGPVSIIDPMWKQMNKSLEPIGLRVGLAYTAVYQGATSPDSRTDPVGGDIDLFGDWRLLGEKGGQNNGYLYFAAENRHAIGTPTAPNALDNQIGSLWGTVNGFGEQHLALKEIYWQQHFDGDKLIVRVGKLDAENYYNSNISQSDSKYFMNQAFSSFPVRAFPSNGLGVNVTAKPSDQWYISTGFQDAQGKKTEAGFDTFFHDFNLFGAFELGFTPTIDGLGKGTYRFTGWYRDAGASTGSNHDGGFAISFDQRLREDLVGFFRAGWGEGNINGIEYLVSGGIGWHGPLITKSDVCGIGIAWGRPSDGDLDDQYAAEAFYRLQVSPDNQLTIGYQVIVDPTFDPDTDVVGVFELRWRTTL